MEVSGCYGCRRFCDRRNSAARDAVLQRIRAEFSEMPCLRLTCRQAQRLFGLRQDVCERVMTALVADGTLLRGQDGRYRLRRAVEWHTGPWTAAM